MSLSKEDLEYLEKWRGEFRNASGKAKTISLFVDHPGYYGRIDDTKAMFTLKEHDIEWKGRKVVSLQRLYLEICDPDEYKFAIEVFGEWGIWQALVNSTALEDYVMAWRGLLETKIRSEALEKVLEYTKGKPDKDKVQALKWLAAGQYKEKKRGRFKKSEIEAEKRVLAGVEAEIESDYERLHS